MQYTNVFARTNAMLLNLKLNFMTRITEIFWILILRSIEKKVQQNSV